MFPCFSVRTKKVQIPSRSDKRNISKISITIRYLLVWKNISKKLDSIKYLPMRLRIEEATKVSELERNRTGKMGKSLKSILFID